MKKSERLKRLDNLYISAVIVAAGRSTRMNMEISKQYIDIGGKPVIARTLQVFQDFRYVDEIILVVGSDDIVFCKQNIVDSFGFDKVKTLVSGGEDRQASVLNGLNEVSSHCDIVLIHDGARPFVNEGSLLESILAANEFGASCVAVPVKDTIKAVNSEGFADKTLDRSILWSVQTPQTFRYSLILEAHRQAGIDGFRGTDDAVLVERLGLPLKMVMGSYYNLKITTREDLVMAEAIAASEEGLDY